MNMYLKTKWNQIYIYYTTTFRVKLKTLKQD